MTVRRPPKGRQAAYQGTYPSGQKRMVFREQQLSFDSNR